MVCHPDPERVEALRDESKGKDRVFCVNDTILRRLLAPQNDIPDAYAWIWDFLGAWDLGFGTFLYCPLVNSITSIVLKIITKSRIIDRFFR